MGLSPDAEKRERQLANLALGRVPNDGKPKGTIDLKKRLRRLLLEVPIDDPDRRQRADRFVRQELARAMQGSDREADLIWRLFEEDARSGSSNEVELIVTFKGAEKLPNRPADATPEAAGVHILYRAAEGDQER